ncbi:hypothetical protein V499_07293 [Pseudogymnoascus sp. VKM F-103]|nr:hypothetical protein V499_07293 [Pseudogymnoascus sp. VKM F-103]
MASRTIPVLPVPGEPNKLILGALPTAKEQRRLEAEKAAAKKAAKKVKKEKSRQLKKTSTADQTVDQQLKTLTVAEARVNILPCVAEIDALLRIRLDLKACENHKQIPNVEAVETRSQTPCHNVVSA